MPPRHPPVPSPVACVVPHRAAPRRAARVAPVAARGARRPLLAPSLTPRSLFACLHGPLLAPSRAPMYTKSAAPTHFHPRERTSAAAQAADARSPSPSPPPAMAGGRRRAGPPAPGRPGPRLPRGHVKQPQELRKEGVLGLSFAAAAGLQLKVARRCRGAGAGTPAALSRP
jgi:hypothetical protein